MSTTAIVGYARTSTTDQKAGLEAQLRDLDAHGCHKIFSEEVSSVFRERSQLVACLEYVRNRVDAFCKSMAEECGVLFLPSTIYSSDLGSTPTDRLRLGFGRKNLDEGLAALDAHLLRNAR